MFILIANFGNDSIALIEWAKQNKLKNLKIVSVDTGWAAPRWQKRVELAREYILKAGFEFIRLDSPLSFPELVKSKNNFPNTKFHWCAKFLKGLPILDYLDEIDPELETVILLSKRRAQAEKLANMHEFEEESELFGWRKLWHPMCELSLAERDQLITQAGFEILNTRSLECDPCIYNQKRDFVEMEPESKSKLEKLEAELGRPMFAQSALDNLEDKNLGADERDVYFTGCGSEFGCGE